VRGVADAVAVDESGRAYLVIDGKSDVDPGPEAVELYREQVRAYLRLTGMARGRQVFATHARMEEVDLDEAPR
jgi:exodeoxyribonuclease-5